jgi:hypothetical protein
MNILLLSSFEINQRKSITLEKVIERKKVCPICLLWGKRGDNYYN